MGFLFPNSVCQYACLSVYLYIVSSIHLHIHSSIQYPLRPYICLSSYCLYVFHPCIHASINLFIHSSIHSFIHTPIHPSVRPSVHPSIHPSIRPSVRLSIYPSVRPSVCLSVRPSIRPCGRNTTWHEIHRLQRWRGLLEIIMSLTWQKKQWKNIKDEISSSPISRQRRIRHLRICMSVQLDIDIDEVFF